MHIIILHDILWKITDPSPHSLNYFPLFKVNYFQSTEFILSVITFIFLNNICILLCFHFLTLFIDFHVKIISILPFTFLSSHLLCLRENTHTQISHFSGLPVYSYVINFFRSIFSIYIIWLCKCYSQLSKVMTTFPFCHIFVFPEYIVFLPFICLAPYELITNATAHSPPSYVHIF